MTQIKPLAQINVYLINPGSHGVPNVNLLNFRFLLIDFGKVLCSSANELWQNSNVCSKEDYIPQILTVLLEIHCIYIWPLWPFVFCLSFQWLKQCNYSVDQSGLLTGFWTYFTSSVWNFCCWVADVPPRHTSPAAKGEKKWMFSKAISLTDFRSLRIKRLLTLPSLLSLPFRVMGGFFCYRIAINGTPSRSTPLPQEWYSGCLWHADTFGDNDQRQLPRGKLEGKVCCFQSQAAQTHVAREGEM